MAYWISAPDTHCFVVDVDNKVEAMSAIRPYRNGRGNHVANAAFVVDPDHRRFFIADERNSTFDYFCGSADHLWTEEFAVPYTRARFEKVDQIVTPRSESPGDWWTARDAREMRITLKAVK